MLKEAGHRVTVVEAQSRAGGRVLTSRHAFADGLHGELGPARIPETHQRIRAWMSIAVEGNAAPAVIRALRGEPTVGTLHTTNGRWDIVAEVRAESLEAFDAALGRIRLTPGIANTETSILLSTYKA